MCLTLRALLVLAALLPAILPSDASAQKRSLCVHGLEPPATLQVRSGPGPEHSVVGELPAKACGVQLAGKCQGEWCQMALGNVAGWVQTRFIGVYESGAPRAAASEPPKSATATKRIVKPARKVARRDTDDDDDDRPRRPRRESVVWAGPAACVARVNWWDTLRIRSGPGRSNSSVGEIPPWACGVERAGRCEGPWCRIAWRGYRGWVNTYYLGLRRPMI